MRISLASFLLLVSVLVGLGAPSPYATLNDVTTSSNALQTQITGKQATITGATDLTANSLTLGPTNVVGALAGKQPIGTYIKADGTIAFSANQSLAGFTLQNVGAPSAAGDVATKAYVDATAQGLSVKEPAIAATTAALPTVNYSNGTAGVGATLTESGNGALSVDGQTPNNGDRVLIKNQVSEFQNGIYEVTDKGSAGTQFILTRTTDNDTEAKLVSAFCLVTHGTTNALTGWVQITQAPITVGATNIVWAQFSAAGQITAGPGLALNGTQMYATNIVGNQIVASATLTTPNIGAATGTSLVMGATNVIGELAGKQPNITTSTDLTPHSVVMGGTNVIGALAGKQDSGWTITVNGTANRVTASGSPVSPGGTLTLTTPQNTSTNDTPTFADVSLGGLTNVAGALAGKAPAFTTGVGVTNIANVISWNASPGSNVTFTTNSNGQVEIASAVTGGASTITDGAGIGAGATLTIGSGYTVSSSSATPAFASVTAAMKQKGPVFDVTAYGADGSGTTTTVSSWNDSTHPVLTDASSFSIGQAIGIDRAAALETTGNTSAGSGTISSVGSTNGFAVNDYIRVIGGQAAQKMARTITIKVAGNTGDQVTASFNGVNYTYTLVGGDTVNTVATNLAAAITGDATIDVTVAGAVVTVTAHTAGAAFVYENVRPIAQSPYETVRTKVIYETTAANIPTTDFVTKITGATSSTFTVSPVVPSALTGTRIEKYQNRLVTTITGKASNTLTINDAATSTPTSVTVYHDSGTALSSAISAAGTGGTVFIPAGTFYASSLTTGITCDGVSIVGLGKGISIIKSPGWAVSPKFRYNTTSGSASNIVLSGFTADGGINPYTGQTPNFIQFGSSTVTTLHTNITILGVEVLNTGRGLAVYNSSSVRVRDCRFADMVDTGVQFGFYDNGSTTTDTRVWDIWVTGTLAERCARFGVLVYGDGAAGPTYTTGKFFGVHVNGNTFRHCGLLGVQFYTGIIGGEMTGNTVSYCGGKESMWSNGSANDHGGLTVKYCRNVVVSGNSIRNCWRGLEVFGRTNDLSAGYMASQDIKLIGNVVSDSYQGVNHSNGSMDVEISDNIFDTLQSYGIAVGGDDTRVWPTARIRISGNTIRNAQIGIHLAGDAVDTEISNNLIDSCNTFEENSASRAAIWVGDSNGTHPSTNCFVLRNRMIESRITPAFAQFYAVYADYIKGLTMVGNQALNNQNNTYTLTANGTLTQSTMNTWDSEAFYAATTTGTGGFARQTSPAFTAPTITGRTWSTINGTTPTAGTIDYCTDLGVGTHMAYVGSRWKPMNGRATLKLLAAPQSSIANSETIVVQTQIPAGAWQVGDVIRITFEGTKSGATDTMVGVVRMGTAGTTSDTAVINGATFMAASGRTWAGFLDFKLLSATSVLKVGSGNANSTGVGSTTTVAQTPVAISSAASNALYISLGIKSGSTNDTVGIDNGAIELLTP